MLSPAHVVIGFHSFGSVISKFCYSLARAISYEGNRIKSVIEHTSPYTDDSRNKIAETFLLLPEEVEFLLMVDGDIEFEKDAISKTIWVAQHMAADVVWGNYSLGNFTNSLFTKDKDSFLAVSAMDVEPNKIYEGIYAGGTGWCLMRRGLLLAMRDKYPAPWHWFDRETIEGEKGKKVKLGEDLTFGKRAWEMGAKQIGYTGLNLIHHKIHATVPMMMSGEQKGDVHVLDRK